MASWENSTKKFIKELIPILLNLFQKTEGNTFEVILRGQHYLETKTRQGKYKKRNLQENIPDKHRCKYPQRNISKPNTTIH